MTTRYPGDGKRTVYQCRPNLISANPVCFSVAGLKLVVPNEPGLVQ